MLKLAEEANIQGLPVKFLYKSLFPNQDHFGYMEPMGCYTNIDGGTANRHGLTKTTFADFYQPDRRDAIAGVNLSASITEKKIPGINAPYYGKAYSDHELREMVSDRCTGSYVMD